MLPSSEVSTTFKRMLVNNKTFRHAENFYRTREAYITKENLASLCH